MYGIGPTHRQEVRRRQFIRIFFEERLLDIRDIVMYGLRIAESFGNFLIRFYKAGKEIVKEHKTIVLMGLAVTAILLLLSI